MYGVAESLPAQVQHLLPASPILSEAEVDQRGHLLGLLEVHHLHDHSQLWGECLRVVERGDAYLGLSILTGDEELSDDAQYTVKQVLLREATVHRHHHHRRDWAELVIADGSFMRMRTVSADNVCTPLESTYALDLVLNGPIRLWSGGGGRRSFCRHLQGGNQRSSDVIKGAVGPHDVNGLGQGETLARRYCQGQRVNYPLRTLKVCI